MKNVIVFYEIRYEKYRKSTESLCCVIHSVTDDNIDRKNRYSNDKKKRDRRYVKKGSSGSSDKSIPTVKENFETIKTKYKYLN